MIQQQLEALTRISNRKNYRAFLYDCDGTLADNMDAHKAAYAEVAGRHGITLDTAIIDELAGWPTVLVAEEINRRYGSELIAAEFAAEKSAVFIEKYISDTLPIAFVAEHLKNHTGKVRVGVVSGGRRSTVTKTLTVIGLLDTIETLVCAGDTARGKPYPDPFLLAAQQLGVAPQECLVFEDGDPGVRAAIAAGMDWVRIDQV